MRVFLLLALLSCLVCAKDALFYQARGANQWLVRDDTLLYKREVHQIVFVADPDVHSRVTSSPYLWKTTVLRATLKEVGEDNFVFEENTSLSLQTDVNRRGRSLELSEVVRFQHMLLAMCDYTGLVGGFFIFGCLTFYVLSRSGSCASQTAVAFSDGRSPMGMETMQSHSR